MEEKDQRPCCQTKRISRTEETLSSAAATSEGGFGTTSRRSPARRWFCSSVRFLGPHRALAFLVLISWYSVLVRCFAVGAGHQCGFGPAPGSSTRTKQARIQHHGPRRRHNNYNYYYYYHTSGLSTLSTATGSIPAGEEENEEQTEGLAAIRGGDSYNEEYYSTNPWPAFDKLDKRLVKISLPVIANYAINPMIGAVDLFWVNRMGKPLAVAGQAAANQVFNSVFWLTSFLPSVSATLISAENAGGNTQGVQDAVCNALFVGVFMAVVASALLLLFPGKVLGSVLTDGHPALAYAKPYLLIRSFAFIPSLISLVGFSAFRGVLDTMTPVKISAFANLFNAVLDPILIFTCGLGVPGAALATLVAEIVSAATYLAVMRKRKMIRFRKIMKPPSLRKLEPLIKGGAALQLRNVALNLTFLAVTRVVQSIDKEGIAAAAHAISIQTFQIGGIVLLALSTVAQTVVPNDLVARFDRRKHKTIGGKKYAQATVNRLMSWGLILGIGLGLLQIAILPVISKSTPIQAVRDAALVPAILASVFQAMNGLVFIGEGVMIGTLSFLQLSLGTVVATAGCLWALQAFPPKYGLTGVWIGFGVFNLLRLIGVFIHQRVNGPLAPKNLDKN